MKRILFGSIVRDGESYLPRYFEQLNSLTDDYEIGLVITEGDSTDNTFQYLTSQRPSFYPYHVFKYDHKGQKFGSVDNPTRWTNIAKTWNYMLDHIHTFDDYDYFCYIEADLIWDKQTIDKLVEGMAYFNAVAPMSMMGTWFYDTWGHRSFGERFSNLYPYHSAFQHYLRYMPLQSAGSCIMMDIEVIKKCRLSLTDAMIGHDVVKNGYLFMLDKEAIVNHP